MKNIIFMQILFSCSLASFFSVEQTQNSGLVFNAPENFSSSINQEFLENFREDLPSMHPNMLSCLENFFIVFRELKNKDNPTTFHSLVESFMTESSSHPLFLATECGTDLGNAKANYCPLRRNSDFSPGPREAFFEKILQKTFKINKNSKTLVFYASGGALFELHLLVNLMHQGFSFDNIVFIDPSYDFTFQDIEMMNANELVTDVDRMRKIFRHIQICNLIWHFNSKTKVAIYQSSNNFLQDLENGEGLSMVVAVEPITGEPMVWKEIIEEDEAMILELLSLKIRLKNGGLFALLTCLNSPSTNVDVVEIKENCGFCGKEEQKISRCSQCKSTYYCDSNCQKLHWKNHKLVCRKRQV